MPELTWSSCTLPRIDGTLLSRIWQPALSMAMAGNLETVLTQMLVDDITAWKTNYTRELFAQVKGAPRVGRPCSDARGRHRCLDGRPTLCLLPLPNATLRPGPFPCSALVPRQPLSLLPP